MAAKNTRAGQEQAGDNSSDLAVDGTLQVQQHRSELEAEYARRYPRASAFLSAWERNVEPVIRVISGAEGFRRAGLTHGRTPKFYRLHDLTGAQIEDLLMETTLVVDLVERSDANAGRVDPVTDTGLEGPTT